MTQTGTKLSQPTMWLWHTVNLARSAWRDLDANAPAHAGELEDLAVLTRHAASLADVLVLGETGEWEVTPTQADRAIKAARDLRAGLADAGHRDHLRPGDPLRVALTNLAGQLESGARRAIDNLEGVAS